MNKSPTLAEVDEFSDEKLLAKAITEIVRNRALYWEEGQPFTMSKEEVQLQWSAVDNWYTMAHQRPMGEVGRKFYWNCRLNQERNQKRADRKPEGYANPSGRELSFQKHYECNASVSILRLPDDKYTIQVVRGHSNHSMDDSDTHKKSSDVVTTVKEYGRLGFPAALIKATLVDKARSPEEAHATGMNKVTTKDVNNWI